MMMQSWNARIWVNSLQNLSHSERKIHNRTEIIVKCGISVFFCSSTKNQKNEVYC